MGTVSKAPEVTAKKRQRSPAYPFINLETAIRRAKEFFAVEGRNAAPLRVAVRHWGYEEKSSGGLQTAAALINFGLMQDEGTGDRRKLKLSPLALSILLDVRPDSEARAQAIRTAALTPKIHQQLWQQWGMSQTSDANMKHMLILELDPPFNPNTAETVIKEYRDTMAFAKPDSSATVPLASGDLEAESEEGATDGGKGTAFKGAVANMLSNKATMREDVFSLTEGKATIQWPAPLSQESIEDLRDWLKIVERKIARSAAEGEKSKGQENWEKL
jgi:hypothetical protein